MALSLSDSEICYAMDSEPVCDVCLQGAMTYACGRQFVGYMDRLFPVLEAGLKQFQVQ